MTRPPAETLERGATPWLFAAALAAVLPHAAHQPAWLSVAAALLFAWSAGLWWRDGRLPGRWPLAALVAAGCAGILFEFRTLFGRDAGVALLVVLTALKLLEMRSRRDATVVVTLGYFLLLTHFLYAQDIPAGLWLPVALCLLTAALIRLHGGSAAGGPRRVLGQAALLCVQSLPFMLVLFVLFPRVSGPLWGLPQDAHAGLTGLSETMTPGSIADLVQNGELAFSVRFDGAIPPRDKLYWRGPVLEHYDGRTWRPHPGRQPAPRVEARSAPLGYETTLEPHRQTLLLALDAPTALPPDFAVDGTLTAKRLQPLVERRRFRAAASLDYRYNADESPVSLRRNLALPPGRNPQARALAESWRTGENGPDGVIRRALALFGSRDFAYTLQPPLLGEQPIDDFLFTTRRGFCEHYAAAFVVLMRAAGIPARVVTGYQGGEANPVDGYLVVRQSDAHAWAEVWLAGEGWRRVDPTSAVAPERVETGVAAALSAGEPLPALVRVRADWLRTLRYRWEALNNAWNQHVIGYDERRQRELLGRFGFPDIDWRGLAAALGAGCGLLLLALLGWALYRRPRHEPVQALWRKALRQLARSGVDCAPWETPVALARRVRERAPALAADFEAVAAAYLRARYGPDGDLAILRAAVARLSSRRRT
ncbi:MAG: DUF3488 and transglutaminase-like domain-containing protein [Dechloromonas sp.]|nr:DUF3488 and transglutaminase-like domain-containing protein [Dechloromonas sp.]